MFSAIINYSWTSTNGHFSTTATFFCPGRQKIHTLTLVFNLSTAATFFCPKGGCCRDIQLYRLRRVLKKYRKFGWVNSSSLKVLVEWTGNLHFCTICEITFLEGGPRKSNVFLEKSLKNGCNFLYVQHNTSCSHQLKMPCVFIAYSCSKISCNAYR